MQDFRVKTLDLPDDLFDITNAIREDEPSFDRNEAAEFNRESYLKSFERQIDPIIICLFYGLYKSRKLPDEITPIKFNNNREFGANITKSIELFNNLLYALWVKENQIPEKASDLSKYRKKLYKFLENIQNYNYMVSVIIPYYLSIADQKDGDSSFINRMKHSGFCRYESNDVTPEYIGISFVQEQEDFMNYIKIDEISQKVVSYKTNLERDEKEIMEQKELRDNIEKRIDKIEVDLRILLHTKLFERYPNYWDNIEKCTIQKQRIDSNIHQYLATNKNIQKESVNPFDFMTFLDYHKFITRDFWSIFEPVFVSAKNLESNTQDITNIRNSLKHNRKLTEIEIMNSEQVLPWFESILKANKK
jgi:hypothetical protein